VGRDANRFETLRGLTVTKLTSRLPHPDECDLYHVNRDALFSHHKASELFLQVCTHTPPPHAYCRQPSGRCAALVGSGVTRW
jgi:hypothetical protein